MWRNESSLNETNLWHDIFIIRGQCIKAADRKYLFNMWKAKELIFKTFLRMSTFYFFIGHCYFCWYITNWELTVNKLTDNGKRNVLDSILNHWCQSVFLFTNAERNVKSVFVFVVCNTCRAMASLWSISIFSIFPCKVYRSVSFYKISNDMHYFGNFIKVCKIYTWSVFAYMLKSHGGSHALSRQIHHIDEFLFMSIISLTLTLQNS